MTNPLNGSTKYIAGAITIALMTYFSAQIAFEKRMTAVETTQKNNFDDVQRSLTRLERGQEMLQQAMQRIEATGQDRRTGEPYSLQRNARP